MDTYSIYPKQFNNKNYKLQSDSCFVIMPFSENLNNTYMVIESVANNMKIKCTRADNISTTSEPILNKICNQISHAYFIIVDITNLNPNVFYELGIAHVLRDASKVLIIKEEQTECPSDIKHIHYYSYNRRNLKELKETIEKFFDENNILEDLHSILNFLELLPKNYTLANNFVLSLSNCIKDDVDILIKVLNNKAKDFIDNDIITLLNHLITFFNEMHQTEDLYEFYAELIKYVLLKIYNTVNLLNLTSKIFEMQYKNLSLEWIADYSIGILDDSLYFDKSISWIIGYLKESSPASFDLARYKIEIGLIKSKSPFLDSVLIKNLKSENKTLAEHCANFIKERKTYTAVPVMLDLIISETNPYLVRSCIDALIETSTLNQLLKTKNILLKRMQFVEENTFLNKHLEKLDKQISLLQKSSNC